MRIICILLLVFINQSNGETERESSEYVYDDETSSTKTTTTSTTTTTQQIDDEVEFSHRNNNNETYIPEAKNINCDRIPEYAKNCTIEASRIYNNSIRTPPLPDRIDDWCRSIKYMINCALNWNQDCRNVTDSSFNEESIRGHMFIYQSVCREEYFMYQYQNLGECVDKTALDWEECYDTFLANTARHKNNTLHWTHYETHFHLCCARSLFRKCTLQAVIDVCEKQQVITMQRYSVLVSEGDVFQDCDRNVMYENCPGGDPRPKTVLISKLVQNPVLPEVYTSDASLIEISTFCVCLIILKFLVFE